MPLTANNIFALVSETYVFFLTIVSQYGLTLFFRPGN